MPGTHLTPTSTSEAWEGFGLINNVSRVTDNSVAAQLPRATGLATAVYIELGRGKATAEEPPRDCRNSPKVLFTSLLLCLSIPSGSELEIGELASQGYA